MGLTRKERQLLLRWAKSERAGKWNPKLYWAAMEFVPQQWELPFESCMPPDQCEIAESMAYEEDPV